VECHSFYLKKVFSRRSEEFKYKIFLMRVALEVDDDGYVVVSDNIKYLDASEKVFVSYYVGMFITKLMSREIFKYDYLVHYGIVKRYKTIGRDKGDKKEPDLIAFNRKSDSYSVFEAKGRQNVQSSMIVSAKGQINSVRTISGLTKDMGIVAVAHPIKEGCRLRCSMYDPVLNNEDEIEVTKEELLYLYYYPIYELIMENIQDRIDMLDRTDMSSCEINLKMDNGIINCSIEMDKELFGCFVRYSKMINKKKGAWEEGLKKIAGRVDDLEKDITFTSKWIED